MKLTTVSVTYGRKMDLGGYNSVHSSITAWVNLDDEDDPEMAVSGLRQMARNHVMSELARSKPQLQAKVRDVFLGLPVAVREDLKHAD